MGVGTVASRELSLRNLKKIFPAIGGLADDETVTEIMVVCASDGSVLVFFEKRGVLYEMTARRAWIRT